jgi:hypothetical protein
MTEWFSEVREKYWEIIAPYVGADEKIQIQFVGYFESWHAAGVGLFVITDKHIIFRGKGRIRGFGFTGKIPKAKNVQKIPLDALYDLKQKKNKLVLYFKVDFLGEKYVGKRDKLVVEVDRGKEGKQKESKADLMKRVDEIKAYFESVMSAQ